METTSRDWITTNAGFIIRLEAEVKFNIFAKDQGRVHRFGTEVLAEIFMGNASNTGGSWTGDLLIPAGYGRLQNNATK